MSWARLVVLIKITFAFTLVNLLLLYEPTRAATLIVLSVALLVGVGFAIKGAIGWRGELRMLGDYAAELQQVCPQCGYDLRATPTRCPECGRKVETAEAEEKSGSS